MTDKKAPYNQEPYSPPSCHGFELSQCCGADLDIDSLMCKKCKEHALNECADCKEKNCKDRITLEYPNYL